jgi:catechol 2,3-dioxygenase-like lactoylglutathione lyase family enzyme
MAKGPDVQLAHVGIFVADIRRMEAFYTRFFDFTVTDRGVLGPTELVFLSRDPKEHHQLVLASGRPAELPFNIVNQISFRVASLDDLRTLHARLADEPVTEIRPGSHGNAWSVYFRDPEGNRLELYLDTPWYINQPFREPLDLSQTDEAILRETERLCRASPGFRSHAEWRAEMARHMAPAR